MCGSIVYVIHCVAGIMYDFLSLFIISLLVSYLSSVQADKEQCALFSNVALCVGWTLKVITEEELPDVP